MLLLDRYYGLPCNVNTQEAEAEGLPQAWDQYGLQNKTGSQNDSNKVSFQNSGIEGLSL